MSDEDDNSTWGKIKATFFLLIFLGIAILMLINPDISGDEGHHGGRNGILKVIITLVWGRVAGVIIGLIALFILYTTWKSSDSTSSK